MSPESPGVAERRRATELELDRIGRDSDAGQALLDRIHKETMRSWQGKEPANDDDKDDD